MQPIQILKQFLRLFPIIKNLNENFGLIFLLILFDIDFDFIRIPEPILLFLYKLKNTLLDIYVRELTVSLGGQMQLDIKWWLNIIQYI